ncbi:amidotransferase GatB/YqeY subunit [Neoasaia chiangmaiensis NBRC 101099]|uniref:Aspartyl-tRNA amidotransferase n=1 Tax=Neoasaia chiangmaiensis TaxID=320497 RepID=A0A1U9KTX0_9PROT|nr:GatB/YqeY domain-containing protein [Neoasaia chiangmaiensis]AQS89304.1 aspartyl-tRNA amidotransferase [Neoasaia chiangmaiensis]GBR42707.1 amidotransferase GatB/YqeY subunit [Neoasaia chiangmaiensis NBRC 101099]GEN16220.1 aspartyl-tRNA amidotransferase subunit B [Neoasaia chiangmaiensis]
MSLRTQISDDLKTAMKAKEADRVAQLRGITAKIKDLDVAARVKGGDVDDGDIVPMLRSMIKSRTESAAMYRDGGRPELAEKEEAEIATIKSYLPPEMDDAALAAAVDEAIAQSGAASMKEMGKVMAVLKARFGADLDMGRANGVVKAKLS